MTQINNAFYDSLGDRWYQDDGHAIALLRAEAHAKVAYVREVFAREDVPHGARVLDVACGAGLVAGPLAESGYRVRGIDLSEDSIATARRWVRPAAGAGSAEFAVADALALPDADASADAVLLMDVLEHVESLDGIVAEAARVVRPGGVVAFNTFNRTPVAAAVAIHGFHAVVRDTPAHLHVYRLFRTPAELAAAMRAAGLVPTETRGLRPRLDGALVRSVLRRRVDPAFAFTESRSLAAGYLGYAVRR